MTLKQLGVVTFKPAARYPADPRAVFILALSVFSGLTALAIGDNGPASLQDSLPAWAVIGWGVLLTLGSAVTLAGMAFHSVNGIITEQIGSVIVAATTIFYSGVAFYELGFAALQAVGIILAWGLSCGLRWFQLQSLINDEIGRAHKRAAVERLEADIAARRSRILQEGPRVRVDEHDHLGRWGTGR